MKIDIRDSNIPFYVKEFETLRNFEYESIRHKRARKGEAVAGPLTADKHGAPTELVGVSLSGGGIRSASFCLGALQALEAEKLISRTDYLSTVSGGGYVGGNMIASMTRDNDEFPFATGKGIGDVRDSEPVSHIRDHSRFLAPHGLRDILTSVAIVLRGLAVNFFLVLAALLVIATFFVLTNPTEDDLASSIVYHLGGYLLPVERLEAMLGKDMFDRIAGVMSDPFIASKTLAILLLVWLIGWATRRSYVESNEPQQAKNIFEPGSKGAVFGRSLLIALAAAFVLELQPIVIKAIIHFFRPSGGVEESTLSFQALGVAAAGFIAATATFRELFASWIQTALHSPTMGAQLKSFLAKAAFYGAGLLLPLLIYALFLMIATAGIKATEQGHSLLPAWLQTPGHLFLWALGVACVLWILGRAILVARASSMTALKEYFQSISFKKRGIYLVTVALIFALFIIFAARATRVGEPNEAVLWYVLQCYLLLTVAAWLIGWSFTENANGLHRLYRDRLGTAFRLVEYHGGTLPLDDVTATGPYLLINAAMNVRRGGTPPPAAQDQKSRTLDKPSIGAAAKRPTDPVMRGRNAEYFLFSRMFVGSDTTGYARSDRIANEEPQLDLATAVAISGAAVSSSMGRFGVGILGPTLALLNLRLGYWLKNPNTFAPAYDPTGKKWDDILRPYLIAEAFGRLRSDSARVYVTDGGHIDNIGLYQLLRRRCKLIIVVDSEADPGMNFGAFCDAQRFARIDEGTRITLDWQPVRAAALKRSADRLKQVSTSDASYNLHFAVGRILYETVDGKHNGADVEGTEEGVLLYVKASVTGDEADYILDYERRYPKFPHESTGDLFFSEEQMEAYRALGFHAMATALCPLGIKRPRIEAEDAARRILDRLKLHQQQVELTAKLAAEAAGGSAGAATSAPLASRSTSRRSRNKKVASGK